MPGALYGDVRDDPPAVMPSSSFIESLKQINHYHCRIRLLGLEAELGAAAYARGKLSCSCLVLEWN